MDLIKKLDALGDVGAGPNGISRVAGTTADDDAKMLVSSWIKDAGMRVTWDDDDNIVGYLKGDDMSLPPIVVGSHIDTVVVGAKYAMSELGLCSDEVRLPLVPLTDGTKAKVRDALRHAGLLN